MVTVLTDEADAWGTVFEMPQLPAPVIEVMEGLVQLIERWCETGMPMEALPWQAAPPEVVEFRIRIVRVY